MGKHQPPTDSPCVRELGPGPPDTRCGSCDNLRAVHAGNTVYFCRLNTQPKRVTWPACLNYQEAPPIWQAAST